MIAHERALPHRHVRLGWCFILTFVVLGAVLETLHGFKLEYYLDTAHTTRRHMWTLAHAHGTLFGLLHVAFAASARRYLTPVSARRWSRLSVGLIAATTLIPGGFFFGGFGVIGNDPGVAVLAVPIGALILVVTLSGLVASCWRSSTDDAAVPAPTE